MTVMLALPLPKLAGGVNTAVRVSPVPLIAPKVPPVTTTSPVAPSQKKLEPGSSENVNAILAVSPALRVASLVTILTEGANVSMRINGVVVVTPLLPAASWYVLAATVILAMSLARFAVGVKTAVLESPVPLIASKLPPVTATSPVVPFHKKLELGSSENVKVRVAVSPIFKAFKSELIVSVGKVVSTKNCALGAMAMDVMAALLPAASLSVAPFKLRALEAMATPSASFWPLAMVLAKMNELVPEPET